MTVAADTTAHVAWWYVAALAGAFTLLGVMISLISSWLIARRKNRLDDYRRFENDIIQAYLRLDEVTDVLHNNAGGDIEEEKKIYWDIYREVLRITTRLRLIASPRVYQLAHKFQSVVFHMEPTRSDPSDPGMPELVELLDALRRVLRKELRIPSFGKERHKRRTLRVWWSYLRNWQEWRAYVKDSKLRSHES